MLVNTVLGGPRWKWRHCERKHRLQIPLSSRRRFPLGILSRILIDTAVRLMKPNDFNAKKHSCFPSISICPICIPSFHVNYRLFLLTSGTDIDEIIEEDSSSRLKRVRGPASSTNRLPTGRSSSRTYGNKTRLLIRIQTVSPIYCNHGTISYLGLRFLTCMNRTIPVEWQWRMRCFYFNLFSSSLQYFKNKIYQTILRNIQTYCFERHNFFLIIMSVLYVVQLILEDPWWIRGSEWECYHNFI